MLAIGTGLFIPVSVGPCLRAFNGTYVEGVDHGIVGSKAILCTAIVPFGSARRRPGPQEFPDLRTSSSE